MRAAGTAFDNITVNDTFVAINNVGAGAGTNNLIRVNYTAASSAQAPGTPEVIVNTGEENGTRTAGAGAGLVADDVTVTLLGGEGNDTLTGGMGNDSLYGGDGIDRLTGGPGGNVLEGGADSDVITSSGAFDTVDGGSGDDFVNFDNGNGDYNVEPFIGTEVTLTGPGINATVHNVEEVSVGFTNATGSFLVQDMSGTAVRQVNLGITRDINFVLGLAVGGTVTIRGSLGDDTITIATAGLFSGFGGNAPAVDLRWGRVSFNPGAPGSALVIEADEGDDVVRIDPTFPAGATAITLNGQNGNDTLIGDAGNDTLIGGVGDDTLLPGAGTNTVVGGAGNDTYVPQGGTDTVTDASGIDMILVVGTTGDDVISVLRVNAGADLQVTVNGTVTVYSAIGAAGIEKLVVNGGEGNDALTIDEAGGAGHRDHPPAGQQQWLGYDHRTAHREFRHGGVGDL